MVELNRDKITILRHANGVFLPFVQRMYGGVVCSFSFVSSLEHCKGKICVCHDPVRGGLRTAMFYLIIYF